MDKLWYHLPDWRHGQRVRLRELVIVVRHGGTCRHRADVASNCDVIFHRLFEAVKASLVTNSSSVGFRRFDDVIFCYGFCRVVKV